MLLAPLSSLRHAATQRAVAKSSRARQPRIFGSFCVAAAAPEERAPWRRRAAASGGGERPAGVRVRRRVLLLVCGRPLVVGVRARVSTINTKIGAQAECKLAASCSRPTRALIGIFAQQKTGQKTCVLQTIIGQKLQLHTRLSSKCLKLKSSAKSTKRASRKLRGHREQKKTRRKLNSGARRAPTACRQIARRRVVACCGRRRAEASNGGSLRVSPHRGEQTAATSVVVRSKNAAGSRILSQGRGDSRNRRRRRDCRSSIVSEHFSRLVTIVDRPYTTLDLTSGQPAGRRA